jgi:hypothetical protein
MIISPPVSRRSLWQRLGALPVAAALLGCSESLPPPLDLPWSHLPEDPVLELPLSVAPIALDLHPRVEIGETVPADATAPRRRAAAVVLALPPDRRALRRVDVSIAVKRLPGGEVTQAHQLTFSRDTRERELRLALTPLAAGTYDLEVHTVAQVEVVDEDWVPMSDTREATEHAPFVLDEDGEKRVEVFDFHFLPDSSVLLPSDTLKLDGSIEAIGALYAKHPYATAHVDCWASHEGSEARNRELTEHRCAWFQTRVWERLKRPLGATLERISHGSRDAPVAGTDKTVQEMNRVVRLHIRWTE